MPDIIKCEECKRETYRGPPWCPHCGYLLPKPWLIPADGGLLEIVQDIARYHRKSWLWWRNQAWEEQLSRFKGARIHRHEIQWDDGRQEVLFRVEMLHPGPIKIINLCRDERDIIDEEDARGKLLKFCNALGLEALSTANTSEFKKAHHGGGGNGG